MSAERKITGWHVLAGFVAAFGVIVAVNFTLAYKSVSTFPGLEVKNSYVASQKFEAEREAQKALGWTSSVEFARDGVALELVDAHGTPVEPVSMSAKIGRATNTSEDQDLDLVLRGGKYVADGAFGPGTWTLFLVAEAEDGTVYRQRFALLLEEGA